MIRALFVFGIALWSGAAHAVVSMRGGAVEVVDDQGHLSELPLLRTDMDARVDGDLASVNLVQTFANPYDEPINARYVFPLPEDAAVHAMRLQSGGLVIEGEIRRSEEAKQVYEAAKAEGQQAALLSQDRPNVFVQEVANLPPGGTVRVEIHYAHAVPRKDGAYELVFPMVVGPRYNPDAPRVPGAAAALNTWTAQPPLATPDAIDPDRVALHISLDGGVPIRQVKSPSHAIAVQADGPRFSTITLQDGRTIDNRDFVLRYTLGGDSTAAGVTTHGEDGHGVVGLHIEPPSAPASDAITPREMVFVLDTSGSMSGQPLDSSKLFMTEALKHLRPSDSFRIVKFSSNATSFSPQALPATPENVRKGLQWVESLSTDGGTEMVAGVNAAFKVPIEPGVLRIVVFLTDGYIGNEADVIALVNQERGDARLFALGIGSSVNRWLLEELAREGRGVARVVLDPSQADDAARQLAARLEAPVLTDVRINWGDAPVRDASPKVLPDLFVGEPLRVLARYEGSGRWPITVQGRLGGELVTLPLELALPEEAPGGDALPILWARGQVEDRMSELVQNVSEARRAELTEEIVGLGLEYHLVTQWTSFVAVSKQQVVAQGEARELEVPVAQVAGVSAAAYGNFSGSAAPEPAWWLAAALVSALALLGARPARRGPTR